MNTWIIIIVVFADRAWYSWEAKDCTGIFPGWSHICRDLGTQISVSERGGYEITSASLYNIIARSLAGSSSILCLSPSPSYIYDSTMILPTLVSSGTPTILPPLMLHVFLNGLACWEQCYYFSTLSTTLTILGRTLIIKYLSRLFSMGNTPLCWFVCVCVCVYMTCIVFICLRLPWVFVCNHLGYMYTVATKAFIYLLTTRWS